ncbi:MAG: c-type cytochrome [Bacteroidota bacterium]
MKKKAIFILYLLSLSSCGKTNYPQGKILYENFCVSCHMSDGSGLKSLIPTLVKADYLLENPLKTACIIRNGLKDTILVNGKVYNQEMPAIPVLSEFEIANIMNYIYSSWGNDMPYITLEDVKISLDRCNVQ